MRVGQAARAERATRMAAALESARSHLPGLGLVAGGVLVALALTVLLPVTGTLVWAVVVGVVVAAVGSRFGWELGAGSRWHPGVRFAARRLLRVGVVLLGFQLALGEVLDLGAGVLALVAATVVVTFAGTRALGRWLGVSPGTGLVAAAGFSICGASAIAAVGAATDAEEDEVATGIALITVTGTVAIFALPWAGQALGMPPVDYGIWVGASVQEVAQVVAAASVVSGALSVAIAVKLSRVLLLAPMVALLSARRQHAPGTPRPPIVPLFVVGFLLASVARSVGLVPPDALVVTDRVGTIALAAALFALGTGVRIIPRRGQWAAARNVIRPVLLGLASWLIALVVPLAGLWLLPG